MSNLSINETDELDLARMTARNASVVMAVVSLMNVIRWRSFDPAMEWTQILSFAAYGLLSLICIALKNPRKSTSIAVFWLCIVVAVAGIAESNLILIHRLDNFTPFGGFKLLAMGIAVLAPYPFINGFLAIFVCGVVPVALYWTVLAHIHSKIPLPEPGMTVVACVAALLALIYRLRGIQIEKENARLRTEKKNFDEFARIILVLRDLTNSPLQVIELTTDLLRSGSIQPSEAAARMETSLQKLVLISQMLSNHQFGTLSASEMRMLYDTKDPLVFLQKRLDDLKAKVPK